MAFCKNCGVRIDENMKFCIHCGIGIDASNTPSDGQVVNIRNVNRNSSKNPYLQTNRADNGSRRVVFDGEIHKCPNCGEVVSGLDPVCSCGYEFRNVDTSNAIQKLVRKLDEAETDEIRAQVIKTFPLPNTREDIFEFMLLASSNFKEGQYAARELKGGSSYSDVIWYANEEHRYTKESDAWYAKIEHCYSKAKLFFKSEEDLKDIEEIYNNVKKRCRNAELVVKGRNFGHSFIKGFSIFMCVVMAICCIVAYACSKPLSGTIAAFGLVNLVLTLLTGHQIIKELFNNMYLIPAVIGMVSIIPYFCCLFI